MLRTSFLLSHQNPFAGLARIELPHFSAAPAPHLIPPALPSANFAGTSGDDNLTGAGAADTFDMTQGGKDTVNGKGGSDTFDFGDTFAQGDHVDGGADYDFLNIGGASYAGGFGISGSMLKNVEQVVLAAGNDYKITIQDGVVAAGASVLFNGYSVGAANHVILNGSAELDGSLSLAGGYGDDRLIGGAGNDILYDGSFSINSVGDETMYGGAGNDTFFFSTDFTTADKVFGGDGILDTVNVSGDYSAGVTLSSITGVERIHVADGYDYSFKSKDSTVAAGTQFSVTGTALTATHDLTFNGSAETDGTFELSGGAGNDVLTGGAGADIITGGLGKDTLTGGGGTDDFHFGVGAVESTGTGFDIIKGFDALQDTFNVIGGVSGVDAQVTSGSLSGGTFDADLEAAITAAKLASDHAVVFRPNGGGFDGSVFLIIDANATAGYQAGQDFVIRLSNPSHMNNFDIGNF